MIGLLNLDKPAGLTSAHVVARLRRSSGESRVGHGGTLDPSATGVLPVLFGRATLLASFATREAKEYRAAIRLGAASDTDDGEGLLTPVPVPEGLGRDRVEAALAGFRGRIQQQPPAYSAVHVDGDRAYALARKAGRAGVAATIPPAREVEAHRLELDRVQPPGPGDPGPLLEVTVECGAGFYVRALARDLGAALGSAAYLEALVRSRAGRLRVEDALGLEEAEALGPGLAARLVRPSALLTGMTAVEVEDSGVPVLSHGGGLPAPGKPEGEAFALDRGGRVLALGRVAGGRFLPRRLVEMA